MRRVFGVLIVAIVLPVCLFANVRIYRFDIPPLSIATNDPAREIYSIVRFLTESGIRISSQVVEGQERHELWIRPQRGVTVVVALKMVPQGISTEGSYVEMLSTVDYQGGIQGYYYALVHPLIQSYLSLGRERE
jgi:hypothetical protein